MRDSDLLPPGESTFTAPIIIGRFEQAMEVLRRLPHDGPHQGFRLSHWQIKPEHVWPVEPGIRPRHSPPAPRDIDAMDQVFGWIAAIPGSRRSLRRFVFSRAVVGPSGRPRSWRSIAAQLGCLPLAAQLWHGQAIAMIVTALNAQLAAERGPASGPEMRLARRSARRG